MTTSEDFLKKYANLLDPMAKACQINENEAKSEQNGCADDICTCTAEESRDVSPNNNN